MSGEISEKEVFEGTAPERPKKKWKYRQYDLEEQLDWQQDQGMDSGQPSQDQKPYMEGTEQHYLSRIVKRKSLTAGLMGRRKSQGKYRMESLRESSAQGTSSMAHRPSMTSRPPAVPRPSLAPRSAQPHRQSFASVSPQAPRVSLVPRVSLGPQVALGLDSQPSSTLMKESSSLLLEQAQKSRRQTIRFSLCPKSSRRLSQRSAGPCVSLISAYNELAKMGDPNLMEMVEQEGRTAGRC